MLSDIRPKLVRWMRCWSSVNRMPRVVRAMRRHPQRIPGACGVAWRQQHTGECRSFVCSRKAVMMPWAARVGTACRASKVHGGACSCTQERNVTDCGAQCDQGQNLVFPPVEVMVRSCARPTRAGENPSAQPAHRKKATSPCLLHSALQQPQQPQQPAVRVAGAEGVLRSKGIGFRVLDG